MLLCCELLFSGVVHYHKTWNEILLPGGFSISDGSSHFLDRRWGSCSCIHLWVRDPATAGHTFNRLKKQWWLEVQNKVLLKVCCYGCLQFNQNGSRNIGGCFVMSAGAVQWRVLLLRHCLEGGRDCIFRREWAYSLNEQRQALCLRMLGLLWPSYF